MKENGKVFAAIFFSLYILCLLYPNIEKDILSLYLLYN